MTDLCWYLAKVFLHFINKVRESIVEHSTCPWLLKVTTKKKKKKKKKKNNFRDRKV